MSAETLRVLEMVAEGKLSVEDANLLLKALEEPDAAQPTPGRAGAAAAPPGARRVAASPAPSPRPVDLPPSTWGGPSLEELVQMRNHGVDADFVAELKAAGFANVTPDEAVRLHDTGIDPDDVEELRRAFESDPSDE